MAGDDEGRFGDEREESEETRGEKGSEGWALLKLKI
jgi:hypothetical protein